MSVDAIRALITLQHEDLHLRFLKVNFQDNNPNLKSLWDPFLHL